MIILMGMPKAGTSTFVQSLTSALNCGVAASEVRELRKDICHGKSMLVPEHIDILTARRILSFLESADDLRTVILKTHHGIRADAFTLLKGKVKFVSLIRSPEQVVDSAFRHGVRQRNSGHRFHAFSKLRTPALAALWFRAVVYPRVLRWTALEGVHQFKYEDVFEDGELLPHVIDALGLDGMIDRSAFKTRSVHVYRSAGERKTAANRLSPLSRLLLSGTARTLGYRS